MIKRKWARACLSLIWYYFIFFYAYYCFKISKSTMLFGISVLFCVALVITGGIIKLVFCKCPSCGSLVASNYVTWSSGGKGHHCPRCGISLFMTTMMSEKMHENRKMIVINKITYTIQLLSAIKIDSIYLL